MQIDDVASVLSMWLPRLAAETSEGDSFDRCWARVSGASMLDRFRARRLWDLALEASVLDGDFIECGAYRGGTSCLLGLFIKELGLHKRIFILDSFAGMPAPDPRRDQSHFDAGVLASDLDECRARIRELELDDVAIVVPGWFAQTLPGLPTSATYSLVHLDCDLYASTKVCLDALYPKLSDGGLVIFDDYLIRSPGERMAAQEHVAQTGETLELGPWTQAYLRKARAYVPRLETRDPDGVSLSCDDLACNTAYLDWIERLAQHLARSAAAVADLALTFR